MKRFKKVLKEDIDPSTEDQEVVSTPVYEEDDVAGSIPSYEEIDAIPDGFEVKDDIVEPDGSVVEDDTIVTTDEDINSTNELKNDVTPEEAAAYDKILENDLFNMIKFQEEGELESKLEELGISQEEYDLAISALRKYLGPDITTEETDYVDNINGIVEEEKTEVIPESQKKVVKLKRLDEKQEPKRKLMKEYHTPWYEDDTNYETDEVYDEESSEFYDEIDIDGGKKQDDINYRASVLNDIIDKLQTVFENDNDSYTFVNNKIDEIEVDDNVKGISMDIIVEPNPDKLKSEKNQIINLVKNAKRISAQRKENIIPRLNKAYANLSKSVFDQVNVEVLYDASDKTFKLTVDGAPTEFGKNDSKSQVIKKIVDELKTKINQNLMAESRKVNKSILKEDFTISDINDPTYKRTVSDEKFNANVVDDTPPVDTTINEIKLQLDKGKIVQVNYNTDTPNELYICPGKQGKYLMIDPEVIPEFEDQKQVFLAYMNDGNTDIDGAQEVDADNFEIEDYIGDNSLEDWRPLEQVTTYFNVM